MTTEQQPHLPGIPASPTCRIGVNRYYVENIDNHLVIMKNDTEHVPVSLFLDPEMTIRDERFLDLIAEVVGIMGRDAWDTGRQDLKDSIDSL